MAAKVKKYQVDEKTIRDTLKTCNDCMNNINKLIGKNGDGAGGAKTLIGAIERMNENCWSDGKAATTWYQNNQKYLSKVNAQMKAMDESFRTLDLIENIN